MSTDFYKSLLESAQSLVAAEDDLIANLGTACCFVALKHSANISSLVYHDLNHRKGGSVNWVGFYLMRWAVTGFLLISQRVGTCCWSFSRQASLHQDCCRKRSVWHSSCHTTNSGRFSAPAVTNMS